MERDVENVVARLPAEQAMQASSMSWRASRPAHAPHILSRTAPDGDIGLGGDARALPHGVDAGKGADGVGHIVGAVGKAAIGREAGQHQHKGSMQTGGWQQGPHHKR